MAMPRCTAVLQFLLTIVTRSSATRKKGCRRKVFRRRAEGIHEDWTDGRTPPGRGQGFPRDIPRLFHAVSSGDELVGTDEGRERAGIGPPAVQYLIGHRPALDVGVVYVGDFELPAV